MAKQKEAKETQNQTQEQGQNQGQEQQQQNQPQAQTGGGQQQQPQHHERRLLAPAWQVDARAAPGQAFEVAQKADFQGRLAAVGHRQDQPHQPGQGQQEKASLLSQMKSEN